MITPTRRESAPALVESPTFRVIDAATLFSHNTLARGRAAKILLEACREQGACSIVCPQPGRTVTDNALRQAARLFTLSDDDPRKQAINSDRLGGGNGWTPLYREPAYTPGTVAHMESFDCGPYRHDIERLGNADSLRVYPSRWPELDGFRAAIRSYWDGMQVLGSALFRAFAESLQLDSGFFSKRCTAAAPSTLRLIHYPMNGQPDDQRHVGISEHTDFEVFTVIHQTAPGLEYLGPDQFWREAPVACDRFTLLIGDMLERWTNGSLRATRHRVRNMPWPRLSLVMFFAANSDCEVRPLPQFVSEPNPPRFAAVTQMGHLAHEMDLAEANRQEPA